MRRLFIVGLTFFIALAISSPLCFAAPKAKLWEHWLKNNPQSTTTVDHSAWNGFLKKYLRTSEDGINRVRYIGVVETDKRNLRQYLADMAKVKVGTLNRDEQRAYWINLYNALTVQVILDHFPVLSIAKINISPGFFAHGPWDKKLISIEGQNVSLNDIEHRILRPIWKDARLHYAVNCASLGCPNLQLTAFTAANSEQLLEDAARAYVNHPRGVRIERGNLIVSSIYHWFKVDFGGRDKEVIKHLLKYAEPELAKTLEGRKRIYNHDYDWMLNGTD